ncbi:multiple sugar transport system permease protein [Pararobbsia alpina]|uniref:carbohydrate ABC transporter permease n=1 Tax=Pararobbsia alpina TaxID=621374 RepID=UPI0039A41D2E
MIGHAEHAGDMQHTRAIQRSRAGRWFRSEKSLPLLLLLPSILMIAGVIAWPMIIGFEDGFMNGTLLRPGTFVGLDNYVHLAASDDFHNALWFSVVFAVFNIIGCYSLGLALALLTNQHLPGRGFFRIALLLPWIVPSIVSIVSWRWMIADERALINQVIVGLGGQPVYFLSDSHWAQATVIVIKVWRSFPFMMLSLLAALQGIDRSMYEAAEIDGATARQAFFHITLPQIRNISIVLCLLMTIWTVNDFDTPWLLTQGGPANATENLVLLAYRYTFGRNNVGLGSATSFVTLALLMVIVVILLRRKES